MRRNAGLAEDAMTTALLAIDLINPFDFDGAPALIRTTRRILPAVRRLLDRARERGAPVIYRNDNFGRWRSNFHASVAACTREDAPGAAVVRHVLPAKDDYFVLKPRHSAFFMTPLDLLLAQLHVQRLVLVGIATDSCVLATALDAHVHRYDAAVVADAVAAQTAARQRRALDLLRTDNPVAVIRLRAALGWFG